MFKEVLSEILERVDGAGCVLLSGRDGVLVASASREGAPAPDAIAASMADLYRKAGTALEDAGFGLPVELSVGAGAGHVVLREVTADYLLAASLGPGGSLGRVRFELRRAAAVLEPELV